MKLRTRTMANPGVRAACRAACLAGVLALTPLLGASAAEEKQVLKLALPEPTTKGTRADLPTGSLIEPISDKPRPPYLISKGVQNVALNKPVTGSVQPFNNELSQITDGKKEAFDYDAVEMKKGTQWIQVDLGQDYAIQAVVMWHGHRYIQVIHDVVVQISVDPEFKNNVQTVFNNDADNSSGQGVGTDKEYFETHEGKIVDTKGLKGRYARAFSNGSNLSKLNYWQELEVYALPVK